MTIISRYSQGDFNKKMSIETSNRVQPFSSFLKNPSFSELGKNNMSIEEQDEKNKSKRAGKGWLKPKSVKRGSYAHLAMLVFRSIYPQGFEDESIASDKLNQLRGTIWRNVKKKVKSSGMTDEEVRLSILDPENEVGQEILKKVHPNATITGLEGENVTAWSKKMHKPAVKKDTSAEPNLNKKIDNKPTYKKVKSLSGSSANWQENKKVISAFISKILKNAKDAGYLKHLRGQHKRTSSKETSPAHTAVAQAAKTVIDGLAFTLADIAIRGIMEYELNQVAGKGEEDFDKYGRVKNPDPFKDTYKKGGKKFIKPDSPIAIIYDKLVKQVELSGINFLSDTIRKLKKQWLKIADQSLEQSGFDNNIGQELENFRKVLMGDPKSIYTTSPIVNRALTSATEDIAQSLYNDQLMSKFTEILMDKDIMLGSFYDIDPELAMSLKDKEEEEFEKELDVRKRSDPFARLRQKPSKKLGGFGNPQRKRGMKTIEFLDHVSFKDYIS